MKTYVVMVTAGGVTCTVWSVTRYKVTVGVKMLFQSAQHIVASGDFLTSMGYWLQR